MQRKQVERTERDILIYRYLILWRGIFHAQEPNVQLIPFVLTSTSTQAWPWSLESTEKCLYCGHGSTHLVLILRACNEILKQIQSKTYLLGLAVDCSWSGSSSLRNGLLIREGVCRMLEAESYGHLDCVFSFVTALIDRICGEKTSITSIIYIL